jgi:hypothetical protein
MGIIVILLIIIASCLLIGGDNTLALLAFIIGIGILLSIIIAIGLLIFWLISLLIASDIFLKILGVFLFWILLSITTTLIKKIYNVKYLDGIKNRIKIFKNNKYFKYKNIGKITFGTITAILITGIIITGIMATNNSDYFNLFSAINILLIIHIIISCALYQSLSKNKKPET